MRHSILELPVIDHHCHSISPLHVPLGEEEALALFSESDERDQALHHVPTSLFFRRAIKDWGSLLGCEPTLDAILRARKAQDIAEYGGRLVTEARIAALLVDEAFPPGSLPASELRALLPCRVHPILRLETLLERLIMEEKDFTSFLSRYREEVEAGVAAGCVALKSIIAYRTGLALEPTTVDEAGAAFDEVRSEAEREGAIRLQHKRLLDYCIWQGVEMSGRLKVPIQFHTGFGDSDLDLRLSNPLHLRPLLEDEVCDGASVVLLHAGYPFVREAGYLVSLYANVYVGLSLAIPFVHYSMVSILGDLLGIAPWSKVLYGSDGFTIPELYWWGATHGKQALAATLGEIVAFGSLTEEEALEAAEAILHGNAQELYQIDATHR